MELGLLFDELYDKYPITLIPSTVSASDVKVIFNLSSELINTEKFLMSSLFKNSWYGSFFAMGVNEVDKKTPKRYYKLWWPDSEPIPPNTWGIISIKATKKLFLKSDFSASKILFSDQVQSDRLLL